MGSLSRLSIQQRLTLMIMIPAGLTMILGGIAFYIHERRELTGALTRELSILAEVTGANSAGTLSFEDPAQASRTLESLKANPAIEEASIYQKSGGVFASYRREARPDKGSGRTPPAAGRAPARRAPADGIEFGAGSVTIVRPILLERDRIGTILIRCSLDGVLSRLGQILWISGWLLGGVTLLTLLLSVSLQRSVSVPMLELTRTAEKVSRARDYRMRAVKFGQDELGALTDRFNEMMEVIETNTAKLRSIADAEKAEAQAKSAQHRVVSRVIANHIEVISKAGRGDLTVTFSEGGTDELSVLSRHLNRMIEKISGLIAQMHGAVAGLSAASSQIEETIGVQTTNFMRHTEVATRAGQAVEELQGSASRMAGQATQVVQEAADSSQLFNSAARMLDQTVKSMEGISSSSRHSEDRMQDLAQHLDRIDEILNTVTDLAEQSKLLSLNAAIEAVRAGAAGRGFNIVAMEVRNLALQSKQASAHINKILQDIRQASQSVTSTFSSALGEIDQGMTRMRDLHAIHDRLRASLEISRSLASHVELASAGQLRKTGELSSAIRETVQGMDENLKSNRSIESRVEVLVELARALSRTVDLFQWKQQPEPGEAPSRPESGTDAHV